MNLNKFKKPKNNNNLDFDLDNDFKDDSIDDFSDNDFKEDLDSDFDSFNEDFGGQSPLEKHNDLLKNLTNFEPFLKKLWIEWLGLIWDESTKQYINHPELRAIMNKKGVAWFINMLRTYARSNNILSSLKQEEYNGIMEDIIETTWLNLLDQQEEFGIKTDGDMLKIGSQVIHTAKLILSGAGKTGNYRDFLGTTVSRSESVNFREEDPNQNKNKSKFKGFSNMLRGFN